MKVVKCWYINSKNVYSDRDVIIALLRVFKLETKEYESKKKHVVSKALKLFPEIKEMFYYIRRDMKRSRNKFSEDVSLEVLILLIGKAILKRLDLSVYWPIIRLAERPKFNDNYLVVECPHPRGLARTGIAVFRSVARIVKRIIDGVPEDLDEETRLIKKKFFLDKLSPKTRLVLSAAKKRNIPIVHLAGKSLYQLGYGKNQLRINGSNLNNEVATELANQKNFFKEFFRRVAGGALVPPGREVYSAEEAVCQARQIEYPVVVKPCEGSFGRNVTVDIRNDKEIRRAYALAKKDRKGVIVEKFFEGNDYRLTFVDYELAAATHRIPARVTGDGRHTVRELVDLENKNNPARQNSYKSPLKKIKINLDSKKVIQRQGMTLESVPKKDQKVFVRGNANISSGGESIDVTNKVNPQTITLLSFMTRLLGLQVVGIDVICLDISKTPFEGDWVLIEVNSRPDIEMHHYPYVGRKRDVAGKIIEMIMPKVEKSRIPIWSITGTNGKTTTTRMISHILYKAGKKVSFTTTGSVSIGKRQVYHLGSGSTSARAILIDPATENAVFETAHLAILGGGLAYNASDVSVVTNIREDHLGENELAAPVNTINDIFRIKAVVARGTAADGILVLNAEDPRALKIAKRTKANKVYFSLKSDNPIIQDRIKNNRQCFFVQNGEIIWFKNNRRWKIIKVSEIRASKGGKIIYNIANAMAAAAAVLAHPEYKVKIKHVYEGLESFGTSYEENPGRMNMVSFPGYKVIIDYAHNPDGYLNVFDAIKEIPRKRFVGVIKAAGDRPDTFIKELGKIAGEKFDFIYIKDPAEKKLRGRKEGEVASALKKGVLDSGFAKEKVVVELDEIKATRRALREAKRGDLVVIFAHDIHKVYDEVIHYKKRQARKKAKKDEARKIPTKGK